FMRRYDVHGLALELSNDVPLLNAPLAHLLNDFSMRRLAADVCPIRGTIRPYDEAEVAGIAARDAARVPWHDEATEIYQDNTSIYIIDDRWGIAHIDTRQARWRSWVIPDATIDPIRCLELAIIWPLAQLAQQRGL